MKLPAELRADQLTAIQDTRENNPADVSPLQVEIGTLATGDYSIKGLENFVAIERKSAEDLLACIGRERARFDREIQRLRAFEIKAVVVEAPDLEFFEAGGWRGQVTPAAAVGSILGWMAAGIPFVFAGNHECAGKYIARMLYTAAKRRWREARSLASGVVLPNDPRHKAEVPTVDFPLAEEDAQALLGALIADPTVIEQPDVAAAVDEICDPTFAECAALAVSTVERPLRIPPALYSALGGDAGLDEICAVGESSVSYAPYFAGRVLKAATDRRQLGAICTAQRRIRSGEDIAVVSASLASALEAATCPRHEVVATIESRRSA